MRKLNFNSAEAASKALQRIKAAPLLPSLLAVALLFGIMIFGLIELSGPSYTTLFEGLTPARGGAVIAELQKLGIVYRLSNGGSIIEVPTADLARARLELGQENIPADPETAEWNKLEAAPMTTSQTATKVMILRANEQALEASIEQLSGASHADVFLALPDSSPFLGDQPQPKASVILVNAAQPDGSLGSAVAKLVAGAVPGLSAKNVVVETKGGRVLFPTTQSMDAQRQLTLQDTIQDSIESKLRNLLVPSFGARNLRITVAAGMTFEDKMVRSVAYGPSKIPSSETLKIEKRIGSTGAALGIPGALSNQPPGPTTTPLNPPAPPANAAAGAANSAPPAAPQQPGSSGTSHESVYDVNQTDTTVHPASWSVDSLSVSVVINQGALHGIPLATVRSIVTSALAAAKTSVAVEAVPFLPPGNIEVLTIKQPIISVAMRGALILLSAIALLLGVAVPLTRLGRQLAQQDPVLAFRPAGEISNEEDAREAEWQEMITRVKTMVQDEPAAAARTLQKWVTPDE